MPLVEEQWKNSEPGTKAKPKKRDYADESKASASDFTQFTATEDHHDCEHFFTRKCLI